MNVIQSVACRNSRPSSLPARVAFRGAGSEEGRLFSQAIQSVTDLSSTVLDLSFKLLFCLLVCSWRGG